MKTIFESIGKSYQEAYNEPFQFDQSESYPKDDGKKDVASVLRRFVQRKSIDKTLTMRARKIFSEAL